MRIGLDYGGVISMNPDAWEEVIRTAQARGHRFFLISHDYTAKGLKIREKFARRLGIENLSFGGRLFVGARKAEICKERGVQVFIDDDIERVEAVGRLCPDCAAVYVPQSLWQVGLWIVKGL